MPQPKQVQKLARERMARTGETYTQARKAVLAGAGEGTTAAPAGGPASGAGRSSGRTPGDPGGPAAGTAGRSGRDAAAAPPSSPVPGEPEELPEYPATGHTVQHDADLWHRVLTQAGVVHPVSGEPMSQELLAGLAGGIGFMVFTFQYAEATTATVVTRAHPEPFTENLLARCGANVRVQTTGSADRAARHLEEGLDAGRAVVVRAGLANLPWVRASGAEAEEALDVAVLGEDESGKLIVDDGAAQLHLMRPGQLAAARAARKREKHWQAWVPTPGGPSAEGLAANALAAARGTAGRMLGTLPLERIPAHFAKNFGVAGLRTWSARLADPGAKGWAAMFADPERLAGGLGMLAGFLRQDRFGGPGGMRGAYAAFLTEAAALPGLAGIDAAAGRYRDLAPRWDALAAAVDPSVDPAEAAAHFRELAGLVSGLADAEERAARTLQESVDALG